MGRLASDERAGARECCARVRHRPRQHNDRGRRCRGLGAARPSRPRPRARGPGWVRTAASRTCAGRPDRRALSGAVHARHPAGVWHAIVPDPEAPTGVAFFTRPGPTIEPFSVVGPRAEPGLVHLDTLPASPWPALRAQVVDTTTGSEPGAAERAGTTGTSTVAAPARPARVVPYAAPGDSYTLPLDTGTDTLFVMASRGRSWDRAPVDVAVHRHDPEDEYIVLDRRRRVAAQRADAGNGRAVSIHGALCAGDAIGQLSSGRTHGRRGGQRRSWCTHTGARSQRRGTASWRRCGSRMAEPERGAAPGRGPPAGRARRGSGWSM